MRRVVVTGLGLVTPLANGVPTSWQKLTAGESGIKKIPDSLFDASDLPTKIAGLIPRGEDKGTLKIEDYISVKDLPKMDKFIQYAIVATKEAMADAGLSKFEGEAALRAGVLIGSGIGGLGAIEESVKVLYDRGPRRISPFFIPSSLINLISGFVSIEYGFMGPNTAVVTACATSSHAIGDAARLIACDEADIMVAGGAEAAVCKIGVAGFNAARALSTKFNETPEKASRPWDVDRDGFVMGEGAGVVVLEEYEHAKKRGATIYGEVVGYGMTGDAHHITAPSEDGNGAFRAMQIALKKAGLTSGDIDYINAHGTSTPLGDMIELRAIKRLFEADLKNVAISSTKSAIGHLLGAAGSVEAIFSLLAMRDGIIPPTLNLDNPSEGCEGVDLVPHRAKEKQVNIALSNSFGFGGTNASLIFKRV
jgi:3-oxoacyl-[acyl-carrier-protein] synthase II